MNTSSSSRRRLFFAGCLAFTVACVALVARSQTTSPADIPVSISPSVQMVTINNAIGFFDPAEKRVYIYSTNFGPCVAIYKMDKLGDPLVPVPLPKN